MNQPDGIKKHDAFMKHCGVELFVQYYDHTTFKAFSPRNYSIEIINIEIQGKDVTRLFEFYGIIEELRQEILKELYGRLS